MLRKYRKTFYGNFIKTLLPFSIVLFSILFIIATFAQTNEIKVVKEKVKFTTDDGFNISAIIGKPEKIDDELPAVILIHQGGSNKSEWNGFFEQLVKQNYIVLAYDIRGHGESDKVDNIYALFNDPNQAPHDLISAIEYLKDNKNVDAERIAIVGASIGANLACVGISKMDVKTAVAISGKTSAVENLNGSKDLDLKSIFYIASEGDQNGKRVEWAKQLYNRTEPPRKIEAVPNSSAHGVSIFKDHPKVKNKIIKWLKDTL